jgi:hypothetical protein
MATEGLTRMKFAEVASWIRRAGAVAISAAAATAALGVAAPASMAAVHATPAAASATVHPGKYGSWKAAQRAAGFSLLRPASTDGLKNTSGGILVGQCANYPRKYADVYAQYGRQTGKLFGLIQDDAPRAMPCSNIGEATTLGHYKVDGARATLLGACGTAEGEPSCHAAHLWLFLTWVRHGHYYQVLSHDESRNAIVVWGRQLHNVG